jgi:GTP-binding protein HflX
MNVTFSLLDQMHIDDKPLIFLYNKVDKYQNEFLPFVKENELIVSLKDDSSLNDIMHLIDKTLSFYYVDVDLFIPYEHSDDYYQILNEECVINTCEIESGYKVSCKIAKKRYKNYARYLRLSTD